MRCVGGRVYNAYMADIGSVNPGKLKQINLGSLSIRHRLTMIPVPGSYLFGLTSGRTNSPQMHSWVGPGPDGTEIHPAAVMRPNRIHIVAWVLSQVLFARSVEVGNHNLRISYTLTVAALIPKDSSIQQFRPVRR